MTFVHRTLDFLLLFLTLFFPSSYYSYLKEFGFTIPDRPITVDDIRVRGCGQSGITSVYKAEMGHRQAKPATVNGVTYRVPHISLIRHDHTQAVSPRPEGKTIKPGPLHGHRLKL